MGGSDPRIQLQEALFHRDRFLEADYGLGEAIERMLDGTGSHEECLDALLQEQAAYASYVRAILDSLHKHCGDPEEDDGDDELTTLAG
jgi:hypothetical protein